MLLQLRLADQHNLEGGSLEGVGSQATATVQGSRGAVLRLIDDERHIPALVELVPEELLQLGQHGPASSVAPCTSKWRAIRASNSRKERRACQSTIVVSCCEATRAR